jgi:Zn-dependent peptidase ImmA (M78 family)
MRTLSKGSAYARALARELKTVRVDLRRAASRLGLEIREVDANGFDGALVRARELPCGTIVLRKSIREAGRKNFTIAHELAHFLLPGHDQSEAICTKFDIGNWCEGSKHIEREADDFAAELLMPVSAVRPIMDSARPSLQLIEKIAKRFGTSFAAAAWRYCDLVREPCAIVWSTAGRIIWSKQSEAFRYRLPPKRPVRKGTLAASIFARIPIPDRPQDVPAGLWSSDFVEGITLTEQAKALPAYSSVISLLWVRP